MNPVKSVKSWVLKRAVVKQTIVFQWQKKGKPNPPPHVVKQRTLRAYAQTYGLKILVETGTYFGDMVEAMKTDFDKIYSIELSEEFYRQAKLRFKDAAHVEIIQGDSGIELETINEQDKSTHAILARRPLFRRSNG
ncbi:MAG: hypothetical protein M5U34_11425 [Chloroflexi bacterium]|nr:hypothetical protein [Chloroflexota bacterium]